MSLRFEFSHGPKVSKAVLGALILVFASTNLGSQQAFAVTITAIASGSTNPATATHPAVLGNGTFQIKGNSQYPKVGDGYNETTYWTFDFPSYPSSEPLTSALLTLTITTTEVGSRDGWLHTDGVQIAGLPGIASPLIQKRPRNKTITIELQLLEYYCPSDILGVLTATPNKIPMLYSDDALVSYAKLELSSDKKSVASRAGVQDLRFVRQTDRGFEKIEDEEQIAYGERFYVEAQFDCEPQRDNRIVTLEWGQRQVKRITVFKQDDRKLFRSEALFLMPPEEPGQ